MNSMITIEKIGALRSQRKTYKEIGYLMSVSKQRIHQIYKNYGAGKSYSKQRERVISISRGLCALCGLKRFLEVHHVDGNRGNNTPQNLAPLCRKCHRVAEKKLRVANVKKWEQKFQPKAVFIAVKCANCGTVFRKVPRLNTRFCSRKCYLVSIVNRVPKRERNRIRARNYYHKNKNESWHKEKVRQYNARQYAKKHPLTFVS